MNRVLINDYIHVRPSTYQVQVSGTSQDKTFMIVELKYIWATLIS